MFLVQPSKLKERISRNEKCGSLFHSLFFICTPNQVEFGRLMLNRMPEMITITTRTRLVKYNSINNNNNNNKKLKRELTIIYLHLMGHCYLKIFLSKNAIWVEKVLHTYYVTIYHCQFDFKATNTWDGNDTAILHALFLALL